jgi:hypothetical protein
VTETLDSTSVTSSVGAGGCSVVTVMWLPFPSGV